MIITAWLILGFVLSLMHAQHLGHVSPYAGRPGAEAAAIPDNDSPRVSDISHIDMNNCPVPEWNVPPHPEFDTVAVGCLSVPPWQSAAGEVTDVVPPPVLPVARGPDLQAVLQRFTL